MTISSTDDPRAGPYPGNGTQTSFPFYFKAFGKESLRFVHTDEEGAERELMVDSDISVILNADQNANPGGTATYPMSGAPLPVGEKLTIVSDLGFTQETDITNMGGFYPQVVEDALDRITMLVKQLDGRTRRALQLAVSTPDGVNVTLPAPSANSVIGWDASGANLANYSPDTSVSVSLLENRLADPAGTVNGDRMVGVKVNATGSIARTQHDRNDDRRTLFDFDDKLKAGGTLDAASAVTKAITAAMENGTGVLAGSGYMDIIIPVRPEGGLLRIDSQVVIPGECLVRFIGEGGPYFQSGFLQGFAGDMFTCTSGNLTAQFHNLRFQGQKALYPGNWAALRTTRDAVHAAFTGIMFREWGGVPLELANIFDCDFDNIVWYGNKGGCFRNTGGASSRFGKLCTQVTEGFGLYIAGGGHSGGPFFLEGDLIDNNPAGANLSNRALRISGTDNLFVGGTLLTNPLNNKTPVEFAPGAERSGWIAVAASGKGTAANWVTLGAGANHVRLGGGLQTAVTGDATALATVVGDLIGPAVNQLNGEVLFGRGSANSVGGPGLHAGYHLAQKLTYLRATHPGVENLLMELVADGMRLSAARMGFFDAAAITKPDVTGSRANPQQALQSLLLGLQSLGLVTNSTTA